jgi:hypothetical protein
VVILNPFIGLKITTVILKPRKKIWEKAKSKAFFFPKKKIPKKKIPFFSSF